MELEMFGSLCCDTNIVHFVFFIILSSQIKDLFILNLLKAAS